MAKVKVCEVLNKTKEWSDIYVFIDDAIIVAEKTMDSGLYLFALKLRQLLANMASEEVEL